MKTFGEFISEMVAADLAGPNTEKYVNPNNACQGDAQGLKKRLWPGEAIPEFMNWDGEALVIGKDSRNITQNQTDDLNRGVKSVDYPYANAMGQDGGKVNWTNANLAKMFKGVPMLFINSVWLWKISPRMNDNIPKGDSVANDMNRKVMDYTLKNFKGKHIFILGKTGGAQGLDLLYGTKFSKMEPLVDQISWKGYTVHMIPHSGFLGLNQFMKGSGKGAMSNWKTKSRFGKDEKIEIIREYVYKSLGKKYVP